MNAPALAETKPGPGRWSRLIGNRALLSLGAYACGLGFAYAVQILAARLLDVARFGVFSFWIALVQIGALVAAWGVPERILSRFSRWSQPRQADSAAAYAGFTSANALGVTALLVLVAWLRPGDGFPVFWVALLPVPATLILVASAALVAADRPILARFLQQGLPPAAACVGLVLLALALAPAPVNLEGVMAVHAVSGLLACGVAWTILRALPDPRALPDRMWHPGRWKALASRGWPYMASSIAPLLMARQDRVMIDVLVGPAETGLYAASAQLAQLVVLGLNAFNQIAVPKLAAAWNARDLDTVSSLSRRTTALALGFAGGAMLVLTLAGRSVLGWFGEEYLVALPALLWIGAANVFVALCGPCGYLMAITGHGSAQARIVGVSLVVNTVLNLVLIPRFGATGAAAATALALVSWNAGSFLFVTRRLALRTVPFPFSAP